MELHLGNKELQLNQKSMIVTETDIKGNIIFASKDFCQFAGYTNEELVGKPHSIVRHKFMPKVAFQELWDTVKKGAIWSGIVVNTTKTGGYYWVKATVYPSKSSNGEIKYISVRVMPSQAEVQNAIKLYPTLQ